MKPLPYIISIVLFALNIYQYITAKKKATDELIARATIEALYNAERAKFDSLETAYAIGRDSLLQQARLDSTIVSDLLKRIDMNHPKWPGSDFSDKDSEALKAIILWQNK